MAASQRLILASASQGRRWLFDQAGFRYEVMPSGVAEHDGAGVDNPRRYVAELAWQKAAAVASGLPPAPALIVAADSTVWHNGHIIGKPIDAADARRILGSLSGTIHELWTGVCVWRKPDDWQVCWQEVSQVHMRTLTPAELDGLIASGGWQGKAGGYGLESEGDPFLTVKTGTASNVIGLPMETLRSVLAWCGYRQD